MSDDTLRELTDAELDQVVGGSFGGNAGGGPGKQINRIDRGLRGRAGHQRRRWQARQMHALQRVLYSHGGNSREAGQQRQRPVGVFEGTEPHGEREEGGEQNKLDREHDAQRGPAALARYAAEKSRKRDHGDEFRECQDLVENAVAAQHECRAQCDEIAGDMSDEKSAQPEKAHGVDETAIEREEGSDGEASARFGHAKLPGGRIIPASRLWP